VLGEGLEKRTADLAAEVAEQTAAFEAAAAAKAAAEAAAPAAEAAPAADDAPKMEARHPAPWRSWECALVRMRVQGDSNPAHSGNMVPEHVLAREPRAEKHVRCDRGPAPERVTRAAQVSAKLVKQLRDKSGAGMMDCKKALAQSGGDFDAAAETLRKKGLASADKKAGRVAAEGAVASYIHAGARLGVLVEVNCETDFVARGDKFRELVADLAMQIAASPGVSVVAIEDVSAEELDRERAIELQKEDILSKPEAIRCAAGGPCTPRPPARL